VGEYAALLKEYRVGAVSGDNYSAAWVEEAFKAAGVKYVRADKPKSQLLSRSIASVRARRDLDPRSPPAVARAAAIGAAHAPFGQGHDRPRTERP
jgi:hypothetical protein